jgi:hypothetical protein
LASQAELLSTCQRWLACITPAAAPALETTQQRRSS